MLAIVGGIDEGHTALPDHVLDVISIAESEAERAADVLGAGVVRGRLGISDSGVSRHGSTSNFQYRKEPAWPPYRGSPERSPFAAGLHYCDNPRMTPPRSHLAPLALAL